MRHVSRKFCYGAHSLWCKSRNVLFECLETIRIRSDEITVDPTFTDQNMREAIEQREVRFRRERQMQRRRHSRFGLSRIDDDDLRPMWIAADSLPKDRMSNAEI